MSELNQNSQNKKEIFPLKENVKTVLRLKPSQCQSLIYIQSKAHYYYDTIYRENVLNRKIYDSTVLPMIKSFMKGIDVNFIALGPKNGGKTYTFIGEKFNISAFKKDSKGIALYAITSIFKALNFMKEKNIKYHIGYSLLEIPDNGEKVNISLNESFKGFNNLKDVKQAILRHYKERKSENSHSIFNVTLVQYRLNKKTNAMMKFESRLNFIDFSYTITEKLLEKLDINPFIEPKENLNDITNYCPCLHEIVTKALSGRDRTIIFHCTPFLNNTPDEVETMSKMENIVQLLRIPCSIDINCTESSNSSMVKENLAFLKKKLNRFKQTISIMDEGKDYYKGYVEPDENSNQNQKVVKIINKDDLSIYDDFKDNIEADSDSESENAVEAYIKQNNENEIYDSKINNITIQENEPHENYEIIDESSPFDSFTNRQQQLNNYEDYYGNVAFLEPIAEEDSQEVIKAMQGINNSMSSDKFTVKKTETELYYSEPIIKDDVLASDPSITKISSETIVEHTNKPSDTINISEPVESNKIIPDTVITTSNSSTNLSLEPETDKIATPNEQIIETTCKITESTTEATPELIKTMTEQISETEAVSSELSEPSEPIFDSKPLITNLDEVKTVITENEVKTVITENEIEKPLKLTSTTDVTPIESSPINSDSNNEKIKAPRRTASLKRNHSRERSRSPSVRDSPKSFTSLQRTDSIRSHNSERTPSYSKLYSSEEDNVDSDNSEKTHTTYLLPSLVPRKISSKSPKVAPSNPVISGTSSTELVSPNKEKDGRSFIDTIKNKFSRSKNDENKTEKSNPNQTSTSALTTTTTTTTTVSNTKKTTDFSDSNVKNEEKSDNTKIKSLTKAIEAKDAEIKDRMEMIKHYADTLLSLEEEPMINKNNNEECINFEKEIQQKTEKNKNINKLREKLNSLSELLNEKNKQIKTIDENVKNKEKELENSKSKLSYLITVLDEKDAIIKKSNEKVKVMENQNQTLNNSVEDYEANIKHLKQQLEEKENINEALQSQMFDLSERINQAQERMEKLYQLQIKQKEKHKIQLEKQSQKYKKIIKKLVDKKRLSNSSIPLTDLKRLSTSSLAVSEFSSDIYSLKSDNTEFTSDDDNLTANFNTNENKIYVEVLNHYNKIFNKLKEVLVESTQDGQSQKTNITSPALSSTDSESNIRKAEELVKSEHQHIKNEENYQMELVQAAETLNSQVNHWKQYSSEQQRHIDELQAEQVKLMAKIESLNKLYNLKENDKKEYEKLDLIKEANTTLESIKNEIINSIVVEDNPDSNNENEDKKKNDNDDNNEKEKEFSLDDYKEELDLSQPSPNIESSLIEIPKENDSFNEKNEDINATKPVTTVTTTINTTVNKHKTPVNTAIPNVVSSKYYLPIPSELSKSSHKVKSKNTNKFNENEKETKIQKQNQKINDLRKCCDRQSEMIVNLEFSLMKAHAIIASLTEEDEHLAAKLKTITDANIVPHSTINKDINANFNTNNKDSSNNNDNGNNDNDNDNDNDNNNDINNKSSIDFVAAANSSLLLRKDKNRINPLIYNNYKDIEDSMELDEAYHQHHSNPEGNNRNQLFDVCNIDEIPVTDSPDNSTLLSSREFKNDSHNSMNNNSEYDEESSESSQKSFHSNDQDDNNRKTTIINHSASRKSSTKFRRNSKLLDNINKKNNKNKDKDSNKKKNSFMNIFYRGNAESVKSENSNNNKHSSFTKLFSKKNNNENDIPSHSRFFERHSINGDNMTDYTPPPPPPPPQISEVPNVLNKTSEYSTPYMTPSTSTYGNETTEYYDVNSNGDNDDKKSSPEIIQANSPSSSDKSNDISQTQSELEKEIQAELEKFHPSQPLDDESKLSHELNDNDHQNKKEIDQNLLPSSQINIASETYISPTVNETLYSPTLASELTNYPTVTETIIAKTPNLNEKSSINNKTKILTSESISADAYSPTIIEGNEIHSNQVPNVYYDKPLNSSEIKNNNTTYPQKVTETETKYKTYSSNNTPTITTSDLKKTYPITYSPIYPQKSIESKTTVKPIYGSSYTAKDSSFNSSNTFNTRIQTKTISTNTAVVKKIPIGQPFVHETSSFPTPMNEKLIDQPSLNEVKPHSAMERLSTEYINTINNDLDDVSFSSSCSSSSYISTKQSINDENDVGYYATYTTTKTFDDYDKSLSIDGHRGEIDDDLEKIANTTMKSIEKYEFLKRSTIKRNEKLFHSNGNSEEAKKEMDKLNEISHSIQDLKEKSKLEGLESIKTTPNTFNYTTINTTTTKNDSSNNSEKISMDTYNYNNHTTTTYERNEMGSSKKNKKRFSLFGLCTPSSKADSTSKKANKTKKSKKNNNNNNKDNGMNNYYSSKNSSETYNITAPSSEKINNNYFSKKNDLITKQDNSSKYYYFYTTENGEEYIKRKHNSGFLAKCSPNYFDL